MKPSIKHKTYVRYESVIRGRLIPRFGDMEMEDISPMDIQRYISELLQSGNLRTGKGLSPNSVNSVIAVLQGSLDAAYRFGLTEEYRMDRLKRPKTAEKTVECFTPAEQKRIEQAVMADRRVWMRGIILCLYTGLRIGELLALEWSDIDLKKGEISVTKSCHDAKDANGNYDRLTEAPKTRASVRTIPLPHALVVLLREMKKNSSSPFVISGKTAVLKVRSYQRSFDLLLKRLNIPHRGFHSLRHTFATRALECGMDVKTLSELLGHRSPTITLNRYVHSLMGHKREMMNRLGRLL